MLHKYRIWNVPNEKYVFNPHEKTLGLSLRNANAILKLSRKDAKQAFQDYSAPPIEGDVYEVPNNHLPFANESEVLVMQVGMPDSKRKLVAIAAHEKTSVKGYFDFIKVRCDQQFNYLQRLG